MLKRLILISEAVQLQASVRRAPPAHRGELTAITSSSRLWNTSSSRFCHIDAFSSSGPEIPSSAMRQLHCYEAELFIWKQALQWLRLKRH